MKLKSTHKTPIGIALALGMDYIDDANDPRLVCKIEAARTLWLERIRAVMPEKLLKALSCIPVHAKTDKSYFSCDIPSCPSCRLRRILGIVNRSRHEWCIGPDRRFSPDTPDEPYFVVERACMLSGPEQIETHKVLETQFFRNTDYYELRHPINVTWLEDASLGRFEMVTRYVLYGDNLDLIEGKIGRNWSGRQKTVRGVTIRTKVLTCFAEDLGVPVGEAYMKALHDDRLFTRMFVTFKGRHWLRLSPGVRGLIGKCQTHTTAEEGLQAGKHSRFRFSKLRARLVAEQEELEAGKERETKAVFD